MDYYLSLSLAGTNEKSTHRFVSIITCTSENTVSYLIRHRIRQFGNFEWFARKASSLTADTNIFSSPLSTVCLLGTTVKYELNPFEWQTNCLYSTAVLPFSQFVLDVRMCACVPLMCWSHQNGARQPMCTWNIFAVWRLTRHSRIPSSEQRTVCVGAIVEHIFHQDENYSHAVASCLAL